MYRLCKAAFVSAWLAVEVFAQSAQALPKNAPLPGQGATGPSTPYGGPLLGRWSYSSRSLVESYAFRRDGTFRNVLTGNGPIMSGSVVCEGTFLVKDKTLILRVTSAQSSVKGAAGSKPCNDVEQFQFHFQGANTLVLDGDSQHILERAN